MRRSEEQRRNDQRLEILEGPAPILQVESPLEEASLLVPAEVRLSDDRMFVEWRGENKRRRDLGGCLDEFRAISSNPEKTVVRFVKKWGPLAIRPFERLDNPHTDWKNGVFWQAESVEDYRQRALQFTAALSLVASLRGDERTKTEDWLQATLGVSDCRFLVNTVEPMTKESEVSRRRFEFGRLLQDYFLKPSYAAPKISWDGTATPVVALSIETYSALGRWERERQQKEREYIENVLSFFADIYDSMSEPDRAFLVSEARHNFRRSTAPHRNRPSILFSVLVMQLLERASLSDGYRKCQYGDCQKPYLPNRNQRCYCSDECREEARKQKARRRWNEKRQASQVS